MMMKHTMLAILSIILRESKQVPMTRMVEVTGFDNHSNKSIVRMVEMPVISGMKRLGKNLDRIMRKSSKKGISQRYKDILL